ncbi:MAG: ATP-binding cassette domain-containing protein [Nannocystis sp.]|nr:ATP-binding cassette domain-containing protein [Nannocystis sp.]
MAEPVILMEGVSKRFGDHLAVDALDLEVPGGAIYGFIGPNGSGKTTTARMILRIIHPDRGRVVVFGRDQGRAADDRVGYLPEERGLYRKMRVRELLRFHAELKGLRRPDAEILAWLERLGLASWADRPVEALSKGMAQKVQFVAAVVHRPQLAILDEPFSGLDPVNQGVLKDAMLELRRRGATVLFSTHDMAAAERLCDRLMMIYRGRKVLDGAPAELRQRYGRDTIRVRLGDPRLDLSGLPGVAAVADYAAYKELRLHDGADPQQLLRALIGLTRVDHFEIAEPSLHDIFLRIAGPAAPADAA